MNHPPVFIVASERSGTNLLRKRITENQKIYFGPQPAHFLKHLYYTTPFYGELKADDNFLKLIDDALGLCYKHFSPWQVELNRETVIQAYAGRYEERNIFGLMDLLMKLYAESEGYETYICKDNAIFDFVYPLKEHLPEAKFIYLYRDPRDVVLSQLRRKVQNDSVSTLARMWRDEQLKSFQLFNPRFKEDLLKVSYEAFIQDEEAQLNTILSFLNVDAKEASREEYAGVQEWQNLNKPTMKDNFKKYREGLPAWKVEAVEMICSDEMELLGYEPEYDEPHISKFRLLWDKNWGKLKFLLRYAFYRLSGKSAYYNENKERLRFIRKFKHPN